MTPADTSGKESARKRAAKRSITVIDGTSRPSGGGKDRAPGSVSLYDDDGRKRPQADLLLEIARRHRMFRDTGGDAFAQVSRAGHLEVHAVESKGYRQHLAAEYYAATGKGCSRKALTDAIDTLAAQALFSGEICPVWLRTARADGGLVIDCGDPDWTEIHVDVIGWEIESGGGTMFRRAHRALPLPLPEVPACYADEFAKLWKYANVAPADRVLVVAFILGAFKPEGPFPILIVSGEQGTGKSTFGRLLKRLIDPSAAPLRQPPKESRDVLVAALNTWLLCLDNLSWLPPELSDTLCRISTGGAISERTLHTNLDETLVEVQRPIVMNGIEELATRPDLAQRGIHIELEPVKRVMPEAQLFRDFDADAPGIFGAILNALALCVGTHERVRLDPMPRMADFARWAAAGMGALGYETSDFLDAYQANQNAGLRLGLDSSPVGRALLLHMQSRKEWTGTATELLACLRDVATTDDQRCRQWPKVPRALSAALTRLMPALRTEGIQRETKWINREKCIHFFRLP